MIAYNVFEYWHIVYNKIRMSSMTRQNNNYNIIKRVVRNAPRGNVLTPCWLNQLGVSRKLAWWYAYSGWLNHLGSGAYTMIGDQVTWAGALRAVQYQLNKPVHIGGKTALELLDRAPLPAL
jgi:hypothetical protein